MMLDYAMLRLIWWGLLGVLFIGFAIMDGFDLGVAICLPWLAKNDDERRILINCIGPTWEGNQVWFILGGGAIFAAWPALYALSFSGFYLAMLLVLLALILRPVGFKYRSKLQHRHWRQFWDYALFIGGFVPSLIFGVAVGNVLQGVPFHFDQDLRAFYTGSFFDLLNPFAILCGLLSVSMLSMQGANFINLKTTGILSQRAIKTATWMAGFSIILFVLGGFAMHQIQGYQLSSEISHFGPSNPTHKQVLMVSHAWMQNYQILPMLWLIPGLAILSCLLVMLLVKRKPILAFIASSVAIAHIIATVGVTMFPFILPSSSDPNHSLLIWDASSSERTLFIMLMATVIFFPVILCYTAWVYRVLRGEVNMHTILNHEESSY